MDCKPLGLLHRQKMSRWITKRNICKIRIADSPSHTWLWRGSPSMLNLQSLLQKKFQPFLFSPKISSGLECSVENNKNKTFFCTLHLCFHYTLHNCLICDLPHLVRLESYVLISRPMKYWRSPLNWAVPLWTIKKECTRKTKSNELCKIVSCYI